MMTVVDKLDHLSLVEMTQNTGYDPEHYPPFYPILFMGVTSRLAELGLGTLIPVVIFLR